MCDLLLIDTFTIEKITTVIYEIYLSFLSFALMGYSGLAKLVVMHILSLNLNCIPPFFLVVILAVHICKLMPKKLDVNALLCVMVFFLY